MKLEEHLLEYGGFSRERGRCHVVLDRESSNVLVGDPRDNPGTSVTNAVEQVGYGISRWLELDVQEKGRLFQYVPWERTLRHERTLAVTFRGDGWSMPVWTDADVGDPFVARALSVVHGIEPYALGAMTELTVVNPLVRVRIEAPADLATRDLISRAGTIEHISQGRFYYVDVEGRNPEDALAIARQALAGCVDPDGIKLTTPGAPLDQPGTLPI